MEQGGKLSGVAVVMALTLLAAACGSSSKSSNASSGGSTGTGGTTGATTGATTGSSGSSNYPAIPAGPIKIGIDTSLSGPLAAYGVSGAANYKALVNLVNKNGGVDGHPIDLTIENDQGSTTIAATAGLKLISDKIAASLYPGFTGMDNVVAPLFNQHKICTVWNIDDPKFLNASQYPCFYTLLDLGPIQTEAIAKYAASKGLTRVGVIYDTLPTDTVTYSDFQTRGEGSRGDNHEGGPSPPDRGRCEHAGVGDGGVRRSGRVRVGRWGAGGDLQGAADPGLVQAGLDRDRCGDSCLCDAWSVGLEDGVLVRAGRASRLSADAGDDGDREHRQSELPGQPLLRLQRCRAE